MLVLVLELVLERDAEYGREVPGEKETEKQQELLVDELPRRVACSEIDGLLGVRLPNLSTTSVLE